MLADEGGLRLGAARAGKRLGHRALKPSVLKEKIRRLKNKVRGSLPAQLVGAELLGDLPFHSVQMYFQLLFLRIKKLEKYT